MTKTISFGSQGKSTDSGHAEAPHSNGADLSGPDLLERLRAGDRVALEALLEAARPRLAAVALKIVRNRDDAEDVVQDALLKVWRYVGKFEGRAALTTWLHRIVVNTAVDHLRARRSGAVVVRNSEGMDEDERRTPEAVSDETPEVSLARAQVGAVVRGGIARLSVVHRQVLALRELEGESYESIAEIARCPIGTVMSRLHHARQRLAESLASADTGLTRQAA